MVGAVHFFVRLIVLVQDDYFLNLTLVTFVTFYSHGDILDLPNKKVNRLTPVRPSDKGLFEVKSSVCLISSDRKVVLGLSCCI